MLNFLPSFILMIINVFIISAATIFVSIFLTLIVFIRTLCFKKFRLFFSNLSSFVFKVWLYGVSISINFINKVDWKISKDFIGSHKKSYIVVSNHVSWLDTLIIVSVLHKEIPVPKFFMKNSLKYIPFAGQACWALDMPFLKRYSREYLLKHPEARTKDIETTKNSCKKFKGIPTTMVNFVEGTRFNEEKKNASKSTYINLLPPKTMSLSLAIESLGEDFENIIDFTLYYPDNMQHAFKDMLFGRLKRVFIDAKEIKIEQDLRGNYLEDKVYKRRFTLWLKDLWLKKDQTIENFKKQ